MAKRAGVSWDERSLVSRQEYQWDVSRLAGKATRFIGTVFATDEDAALTRAVEQFRIMSGDIEQLLIRRT
jgi:hypothetical protein